MKKLTLVLLMISMLLTAAMAEEVVFPSRCDGLAPLADVLSAPPYSMDAGQIASQHGWVDFIKGLRFPCQLSVDKNGKQLQLTLEPDFAFKKRSLSVSAEDLFTCEFSYSSKAGCYVSSDVTVHADTRGLTPFEFVAAHWREATFDYSAQTDKEGGPTLTMTGSPASGEVASLRIEDKLGGVSFSADWEAAGDENDAVLTFGLSVPVTIDNQKYTATVTADYGGADGAILEQDEAVFAASYRSKSVRIQANLDANGQPVYTVSTASGAVYNTDGALSLLALWNDGEKAWKTSGTPTKTSIPSMDDVAAALSVRIR